MKYIQSTASGRGVVDPKGTVLAVFLLISQKEEQKRAKGTFNSLCLVSTSLSLLSSTTFCLFVVGWGGVGWINERGRVKKEIRTRALMCAGSLDGSEGKGTSWRGRQVALSSSIQCFLFRRPINGTLAVRPDYTQGHEYSCGEEKKTNGKIDWTSSRWKRKKQNGPSRGGRRKTEKKRI